MRTRSIRIPIIYVSGRCLWMPMCVYSRISYVHIYIPVRICKRDGFRRNPGIKYIICIYIRRALGFFDNILIH